MYNETDISVNMPVQW